jgi:hypothetical protein
MKYFNSKYTLYNYVYVIMLTILFETGIVTDPNSSHADPDLTFQTDPDPPF